MSKLTQARLKSIIQYYPSTGIFRWTRSRTGTRQGSIAGSKHPSGYLRVMIDREEILAHRLAFFYMTGRWPIEVDHHNGVRDDNRWSNIHEATHRENCRNTRRLDRNTSGQTGVHWRKDREHWVATIKLEKERLYLGSSKDIQIAIELRKEAEVKYNFHRNHGRSK